MSSIQLVPQSNSKHINSNYKYKINCQEKITAENPTSEKWLQILNKIDHASNDFKILIALYEKKDSIVVKIGNKNKIKKEVDIVNELDEIPNIIYFYCHFICHDNFDTIGNTSSICKELDNKTVEQGVIVIPYYELGQLDKFNWTRNDFTKLKSLIKHISCTLLYAFQKKKFIDRDTHLGNILLKYNDKDIQINYGEYIKLYSHKYDILPIIMDFDRSEISDNFLLVYQDIERIFLLIRSELQIKTNIDREPLQYIKNLRSEKIPITKEIYSQICELIDKIEIEYVVSELRL